MALLDTDAPPSTIVPTEGALVRINQTLGRFKGFEQNGIVHVQPILNSTSFREWAHAIQVLHNDPPISLSPFSWGDRRTYFEQFLHQVFRAIANANIAGVQHSQMTHFARMVCTTFVRPETAFPWNAQYIVTGAQDMTLVSIPVRMEDVDNDKRRREMRIGKFLRWYAHNYPTIGFAQIPNLEQAIEHYAYWWGTHVANLDAYTFEVVRGADLVQAYHAGPHSCMAGKPYIEFYGNNPDMVALLKISIRDRYIGRALLWQTTSRHVVMDRIYPSDGGLHIAAAIRLAEREGWDYKSSQDSYSSLVSNRTYDILMRRSGTGWPYLDTFYYAKSVNRRVVILSNNPDGAVMILRSTSGRSARYNRH